jgi:hypothetical protein
MHAVCVVVWCVGDAQRGSSGQREGSGHEEMVWYDLVEGEQTGCAGNEERKGTG